MCEVACQGCQTMPRLRSALNLGLKLKSSVPAWDSGKSELDLTLEESFWTLLELKFFLWMRDFTSDITFTLHKNLGAWKLPQNGTKKGNGTTESRPYWLTASQSEWVTVCGVREKCGCLSLLLFSLLELKLGQLFWGQKDRFNQT